LGDLEWQPHSDLLAVGMRFGRRLLLDTTDRSVRTLAEKNLEIAYAVAWSKSGEYLATSEANSIRIANSHGEDLHILKGHLSEIKDLQWIGDRLLVSASEDHSVRIWDVESGTQIRSIQVFDKPLRSVSISHDNDSIVMASAYQVKVAALQASSTVPHYQIPADIGRPEAEDDSKNGVESLVWSLDGTELYAIGKVFHESKAGGTGALLSPMSLRALNAYRTGLCEGKNQTGTSHLILRADVTGALQADDPRSGVPIHKIPCLLFNEPIACWSPDCNSVMTYNGRQPPVMRDGRTGQVIREWDPEIDNTMHAGAWNHAGNWFLSSGWDNAFLLNTDGRWVECPDVRLNGCFGVAWHPSDQVLALGNRSGTILIGDGNTLKIIAQIRGHFGPVTGLDFSPNGRRLASASFDGTIRLWDVATGREVLQLTNPSGQGFTKVAWSPDGNQLAAGTLDRQVVMFGKAGDSLLPAAVSPPVHGTVYRYFKDNEIEDRYSQEIMDFSWRAPLQTLSAEIDDTENDPSALRQRIRNWLDQGMASPDLFNAYATACLLAIDGIQDDQRARLVGDVLIDTLSDHSEISGSKRTMELKADAHYRLCCRFLNFDSATESSVDFEAAQEAVFSLIEDHPDSMFGWRKALSLETLRVERRVDAYENVMKLDSKTTEKIPLREFIDEYTDFFAKIPAAALPFAGELNSNTPVLHWLNRITPLEIRTGAPLTFKDEWLELLAAATSVENTGYYPYYLLALARITLDDPAGYQAACREMTLHFNATQDPTCGRFVAWTACLAPDSMADLSQVLELYQRLRPGMSPGVEPGAILYRMHRYEEARAELLAVANESRTDSSLAYVWLFLAMTEFQIGNTEAATGWLEKANAYVEEQMIGDKTQGSIYWNNQLATLRLLQREANQPGSIKRPSASQEN
ncbi:MAG: hypothetical protein KDB01_16725, partial [Planctomycetaceae bacterium]|nr:hypothetical protein [Planctomycetaceae bacterium]